MTENQISDNARRWLKAISYSEGTYDANRGPQYDIIFGYDRFKDYSKHPDVVKSSGGLRSAAAGAYQFMPSTWRGVKEDLQLSDFSPQSQDLAAIELIKRRGVDPDTDPITSRTLAQLAPEWASFPTLGNTSYYEGQKAKDAQDIISFAYGMPQPAKQTSVGPRPTITVNVDAPSLGPVDRPTIPPLPPLDIPDSSEESTVSKVIRDDESLTDQLIKLSLENKKAEDERQAKVQEDFDKISSSSAASRMSDALIKQVRDSFNQKIDPLI